MAAPLFAFPTPRTRRRHGAVKRSSRTIPGVGWIRGCDFPDNSRPPDTASTPDTSERLRYKCSRAHDPVLKALTSVVRWLFVRAFDVNPLQVAYPVIGLGSHPHRWLSRRRFVADSINKLAWCQSTISRRSRGQGVFPNTLAVNTKRGTLPHPALRKILHLITPLLSQNTSSPITYFFPSPQPLNALPTISLALSLTTNSPPLTISFPLLPIFAHVFRNIPTIFSSSCSLSNASN
jgi:hypothetical protein